VNRFFENARDFLRESAMFRSSSPAQRLFQVVGHICADENSLTIRHLSPASLSPTYVQLVNLWNIWMPKRCEQVYKPNSVLRFEIQALNSEPISGSKSKI
jgi:hypothetical protein